MIRREDGEDPFAVVGARLDWVSVAFRVRFPMARIEELAERAKFAKKHGRAPLSFAGDLWDMGPPKVGGVYFVESSARGERLELAPNAPGSFVEGEGEIIPGWSLAVHASGSLLAIRGGGGALKRGWQIARKAGDVFGLRMRRVDVTCDFRGALVEAWKEDDFQRNENTGGTHEVDTPKGPKDVRIDHRPKLMRLVPTIAPANAGPTDDKRGGRGGRRARNRDALHVPGLDAQYRLFSR